MHVTEIKVGASFPLKIPPIECLSILPPNNLALGLNNITDKEINMLDNGTLLSGVINRDNSLMLILVFIDYENESGVKKIKSSMTQAMYLHYEMFDDIPKFDADKQKMLFNLVSIDLYKSNIVKSIRLFTLDAFLSNKICFVLNRQKDKKSKFHPIKEWDDMPIEMLATLTKLNTVGS